jgi:hypothetical protein
MSKTAVRDNSGRYLGTEKEWTEDDLVAAILIAQEILGKTPTFHEMKQISQTHGLPHPKTMHVRFGSWENALSAAGQNSNNHYERDYLVKEIERYIEKYGHIPSTNEFRFTEGFPGVKAYKRLFGSFNSALVELGYTPVSVAKKNKYSHNTIANDGHLCDSAEEAFVDNFLFEHNLAHSIQPLYPRHVELNNKGYIRADFYLIDSKVFVEYAGLINRSFYAAKIEKKQQLATVAGINLLIIYPSDLSNLEKAFRTLLLA